jgi:hypothetical protein
MCVISFFFFLMKMKTRFDVVPSLVVRRRRPVVTSGGSVSRSAGGCDGWRWPRERERTLKRWMTTLLLLTCI